jgi:5'-nucleotidase
MRILVCNDDGLASPGLHLLAAAAGALAQDVWIVAPSRKWTAASHQLTFDRDLTLTRTAARTYQWSGAPADCGVAAMTVLFEDGRRPDLVLAGINDKRNVGEDIAYSGTMAIAREATFVGVPAIALSRSERWPERPEEIAALRRLLTVLWTSHAEWSAGGHWLSIGLPASLPAPLRTARIGRDKIASDCDLLERGDAAIRYRIRRGRPGQSAPGDENAALRDGCIAVVRHGWTASGTIAADLVDRWNEAEGDDDPVA